MEHKLATDEIKEQAALYALGALSQIEAHAFENHLADGCQVCQAEVSGFDSVVGELGLAAPAASPPAHLRGLLTARIANEPQQIGVRRGARNQAMPGAPRRVDRGTPVGGCRLRGHSRCGVSPRFTRRSKKPQSGPCADAGGSTSRQ